VLLCAQGLQSARILPGWSSSGTGAGCRAARLFRSFLLSPRRADVLIAGVLTGFLPCGLVYAHLTLAASQSQVAMSALLMVVFGAGTVPVMVLTGSGMSVLGVPGRRRLLRIAAWCVVLTGALTVNRGVSAIRVARGTTSVACPMCEEGSHVHTHDSSDSPSE
jgi:sulfite exporter TauE/SafE